MNLHEQRQQNIKQ